MLAPSVAFAETSMDTNKDVLGKILLQIAEHARDRHEDCETLPTLPVKPLSKSGSSLVSLGLPEYGVGLEATFDELMTTLIPSLANSTGPRWFSLVIGGVTPAALAADWLTTVYDQNTILNLPSSYSGQTEITLQACKMFLQLLDLPVDTFRSILTTGSTSSNIEAVALARQWLGRTKFGLDYSQDGYNGQVVILTDRGHVTIHKAASMLGIGRNQVFEMMGKIEDVDVLEAQLQAFTDQGKAVMVAIGFGEVNAGIFPKKGAVQKMAAVCKRYGAFLHIDGAFGAYARCSPLYAELADGLELADSITVCGHKWLNVPFDCSCFIFRHEHEQDLARVFGSTAAYLRQAAPGEHNHPMDLSIENSQRFRALPVWATLRSYGREGYRKMVEDNCEFAETMHSWMKYERPDLWTVLEDECPLNIVVFAAAALPSVNGDNREKDENEKAVEKRRQEAVVKALNDTGVAFFSVTVWRDRAGIRAAISNWRTNVNKDWDAVRSLLEQVGGQFQQV
ncbi:hypothetical protein EC991_006100 [Linnemannia zychae]|nr:hypothetical protein EC991_006100 [Linnemannia zychae]